MREQILFPEKKEYRISAENVTLTMLINNLHMRTATTRDTHPFHTHAGAELFVCAHGVVQLQTRHGIVPIRAGDVAIVPPGLVHCLLSGTEDARWHSFDFSCTAKRQTGRANLMQHLSPLLGIDRLALVRATQNEVCELEQIATDADETGYLLALRFLCVLCALSRRPLREIERELVEHTTLPGALSEKNRDIDRLAKLDHLVSSYYMTDLSVSRAAELLFISERQLQRIVNKEYGVSFAALLCQKRLIAAKALLTDHTLSIERVATLTGFPSRAALSRAMQKIEGVTPSAYREKLAPLMD